MIESADCRKPRKYSIAMFTPFLQSLGRFLGLASTAPLRPLAALTLVLGLSLTPHLHASDLTDAQKLLQQRNYAEALTKLDQHLASNAKDAEGRFYKGFALIHLSRLPEAEAVFISLTEDYPEQPEPYNNLANIYALQQQYDRARWALEMAIQTHPSYALAHENLGDLYLKLASQAYERSAQLQSGPRIRGKLQAVKQQLQGQLNSANPQGQPAAASTPAQPAVQPSVTPVKRTPGKRR